jgi:hypothetical protein
VLRAPGARRLGEVSTLAFDVLGGHDNSRSRRSPSATGERSCRSQPTDAACVSCSRTQEDGNRRNAQLASTQPDQLAILDALAASIIREAACTQVARKTYSLSSRLSLYLP